jgi:hypothetical protein
MTRLIGMTIVLLAVAGCALAQVQAPEIDGSSGSAAIALLAGGLLVLRAHRSKR